MERNIELRRREHDRPHYGHDVLSREHHNDIGETATRCESRHPSNARLSFG
jgi:hypothetical protein